jgi:hypothetical protein
MRHVADVLFAMLFFGFAILGIARPDVILRWVKQARPEFAGDDAPLLLIVRLIGAVGFGVALFFFVIVVRSLYT